MFMNSTDLEPIQKENIVATLAQEDHPSIDITSPRVHPSLPLLHVGGAKRDHVWRAAAIAAGCAAATAILIVGWFWLLTLVYQSFARSLS